VGFKPYLKDQLVSFSATLSVWSYTCNNRSRYDLWRDWWDVKPCSVNQSACKMCELRVIAGIQVRSQ